MIARIYIPFISATLGLYACSLFQLREAPKRKARMAILNFHNASRNPNYQWLAATLSESMKRSVKDNYLYSEPPAARVKAVQKTILGDRPATPDDYGTLAEELEVDFLVYGFFQLSRNNNVRITAHLYSQGGEKIIRTVETKIPASTKLFDRTKVVSVKMVDSIRSYILATRRGDIDVRPDDSFITDDSAFYASLKYHRAKTIEEHQDSVLDLDFAPDGLTFASASADGSVMVFDLDGDDISSFSSHNGAVNRVRYALDGKHIVSSAADDKTRIFEVDGGLVSTIDEKADLRISAQSEDGLWEAFVSRRGNLSIKRMASGKINQSLPTGDLILCLQFSGDGRRLLAGGSSGRLYIFDRVGGRFRPAKPLRAHKGPVRAISFSVDDRIVATGSEDKTIIIWTGGLQPLDTLKAHDSAVTSLAFSPSGEVLVSGSIKSDIALWSSKPPPPEE